MELYQSTAELGVNAEFRASGEPLADIPGFFGRRGYVGRSVERESPQTVELRTLGSLQCTGGAARSLPCAG